MQIARPAPRELKSMNTFAFVKTVKVFLATAFSDFLGLGRNLLDHCYEGCTAVHVLIEEMHTIYALFAL